jgi:excisionase family DNA binding protein
MQGLAPAAQELLTARQVQEMLHIDRSTVYRMAGDGRLPSIRVGKQLRFPADQLGVLAAPDPQEVDAKVAEGVIAVMADLLGVTMVVTDIGGRPRTSIVNPSAWFSAHADDQELRDCLAEWRTFAEDSDLAPRFVTGSAGFQCARAFIRSGPSLVGMVLAGGIAAPEVDDPQQFHQLDDAQRAEVLRALPRIASALGARHRVATLEMKESE